MGVQLLNELRAGQCPGDDVVLRWPASDDPALEGVLDTLLDYPDLLAPRMFDPGKDATATALLENAASFLQTELDYPWPTARRFRWTLWAGLALAVPVAALPFVEDRMGTRAFWTLAVALAGAAAALIVFSLAREAARRRGDDRYWPFPADAGADYNAHDLREEGTNG